MNKYRVKDMRLNEDYCFRFASSVSLRPFEVQIKHGPGSNWCSVPGAFFPTKEEAKECIERNRVEWEKFS